LPKTAPQCERSEHTTSERSEGIGQFSCPAFDFQLGFYLLLKLLNAFTMPESLIGQGLQRAISEKNLPIQREKLTHSTRKTYPFNEKNLHFSEIILRFSHK